MPKTEHARITSTLPNGFALQADEIINHAHGDEQPERGEKFSLLPQIRFARFPDDVGNLAHRAVDRQRAGADVFQEAERRADGADEQAEKQNRVAGDAAVEKIHLVERRQLDVRVAGESAVAAKRQQWPKGIFSFVIRRKLPKPRMESASIIFAAPAGFFAPGGESRLPPCACLPQAFRDVRTTGCQLEQTRRGA